MNEDRDNEKIYGEIREQLLPYESWERLEGETSASYAAFCSYRDYGPERNIRRAAEAVYAGQGQKRIEKRCRMWRNWSMQFKWVKRAGDYDRYLDRLKQAEKRKTIEAQEAVYLKTTEKMLGIVNKKLDMMAPGDLSQRSVVEWVETAVKTERMTAGLDTEKKTESAKQQLEINFSPDFEGL